MPTEPQPAQTGRDLTGKTYTVRLEIVVEHATGEELSWEQVAETIARRYRTILVSGVVKLPDGRQRVGRAKVRRVEITGGS